jgi:hypothetical protein
MALVACGLIHVRFTPDRIHKATFRNRRDVSKADIPKICLFLRTRHSAIAAPMTAAAQGNKLARRSCIPHQENAK